MHALHCSLDTNSYQILTDIQHHSIQIFEGPRYEMDDDETIAENQEIMSKVPFAIVGANTEVQSADGRKVRGRRYPWGVIEVDNEEHCDFVKLRQMLIRTHMEELKEHTNNMLYENYRSDSLRRWALHRIRAFSRKSTQLSSRRRSAHCMSRSCRKWSRK